MDLVIGKSGSCLSSLRRRGPDGEEDVRRDRYLRDLHALVRGPLEVGAVREPGPGSRGTIRKYLAPVEAAGLVPGGEPVGEERWPPAGRRVVPEGGRRQAAAGHMAGDRCAPGLHRRADQGRGDAGDDPSAAARRARAGGGADLAEAVYRGESAGGGPPGAGHGPPCPPRSRGGGADRLRFAGTVGDPVTGQPGRI